MGAFFSYSRDVLVGFCGCNMGVDSGVRDMILRACSVEIAPANEP